MFYTNKSKERFFKCFLVGIVIAILIGLIYTSGAVAQWSASGNSAWYSGLFFNTPFSSFNTIPIYRGAFNNNLFPSYGSSSSTGLFSSMWPTFGGSYAWPIGYNTYTSGTGYDTFYSIPRLSFNPTPYMGLYSWQSAPPITLPFTQLYSPTINVTPQNGYPMIIPVPRTESTPKDAPKSINGTWQSQESAEEGSLKVDRNNMILTMEGSSLPPGEGSLTEFNYTPTFNKAPISFKAAFESGYAAEFSGTANNKLPCKGCSYAWYSRDVHNFKVEGEYVIKNDSGQVVDSGTFSIIGY